MNRSTDLMILVIGTVATIIFWLLDNTSARCWASIHLNVNIAERMCVTRFWPVRRNLFMLESLTKGKYSISRDSTRNEILFRKVNFSRIRGVVIFFGNSFLAHSASCTVYREDNRFMHRNMREVSLDFPTELNCLFLKYFDLIGARVRTKMYFISFSSL